MYVYYFIKKNSIALPQTSKFSTTKKNLQNILILINIIKEGICLQVCVKEIMS
jgi:hypothetical protein